MPFIRRALLHEKGHCSGAAAYGQRYPLRFTSHWCIMPTANRETELPKDRRMPAWAGDPFKSFIDDVERLKQVMQISERGIAMLRVAPKAAQALIRAEGDLSKPRRKQLRVARKHASLAEREIREGFPVLHAWAVVALWSHLESLLRTFLASWLKNKRDAWTCEPVHSLRIQLGLYRTLPAPQRQFYIVELLEKETKSGLRSGINRFEELLKPFNLGGKVPKPIAHTLYELGQVRNLIAHSASRVDRRFKTACPWLKTKIGAPLHVSHDMIGDYFDAAMMYVTLLICRTAIVFGVDMTETVEGVERSAEKLSRLPDKDARRKPRKR